MKALLTALLTIILFSAHAQLPVDPTTGKVVYTGTTPLPTGVTSAQAFGRAKIWLSDAFQSHAILAEDAASGLLSGGGVVQVKNFHYSFRLRLEVSGTEVKYRADDFKYLYTDPVSSSTVGGTVEGQRDSKVASGKGMRAKMLAELDAQVREGLAQLSKEVAGGV